MFSVMVIRRNNCLMFNTVYFHPTCNNRLQMSVFQELEKNSKNLKKV